MKNFKATFCYRVVTPESAEVGEPAEAGWILPGMWKFPLQDSDGYRPGVLEEARAGEFALDSLDEVVSYAQLLGIQYLDESNGALEAVDPLQDYETGEDTYYALYIDGVTSSTYRRIVRLITGEG